MRLSPTSYVVLGVIALRGPTTSYDLGRYVATSTEYFWPVQHAQLYREPKRLAAAGLLDMEAEPDGRRRQFFSLTDAGRDALDAWLEDPVEDVVELRDAGLVKLQFSSLMRPDARAALVTQQLEARTERLAEFERMAERYDDLEREAPTLAMGIALEHAAIAFWRSLASS
jgi:PadR family transcriptional regulator, regulatory protein AphA